MASGDRERALADYAAKFDACEDPEALIEQIGTPTKAAISLALNCIPSAAAEAQPEKPTAAVPAEQTEIPAPDVRPAAEVPTAETVTESAAAPEPLPAVPAGRATAAKAPIRAGGLIVFVLLLLVIGVPVTLAVVVLGLPFLACGVGIIAVTVPFALKAIAALKLISDLLLICGGGLAVSAIGLLLAAFGLWVIAALARLWIGGVLCPLARGLCRKKEVPQA